MNECHGLIFSSFKKARDTSRATHRLIETRPDFLGLGLDLLTFLPVFETSFRGVEHPRRKPSIASHASLLVATNIAMASWRYQPRKAGTAQGIVIMSSSRDVVVCSLPRISLVFRLAPQYYMYCSADSPRPTPHAFRLKDHLSVSTSPVWLRGKHNINAPEFRIHIYFPSSLKVKVSRTTHLLLVIRTNLWSPVPLQYTT